MWLRVVLLVLACISSGVWAVTPPLKLIDGAPSVYTVKKGDTLWDISAHFLSSPWLWPQLWQANDYIENPHLIYPGDQLHLIWVDGQPRLSLKKMVKLSPQVRVVRAPITTLQSSLMLPYLAQDKLLTAEHLDRLPRVMGESSGKGYMSNGDTVWVDSALAQGEEWWIYRPDGEFERELEGGKSMQVRALREIAKGTIKGVKGEHSALAISTLLYEIRQNDVLLPAPLPRDQIDLSFAPSSPPEGVLATVLGHFSGINYIATNETVVVNRGHLDGVAAGNIFQVYRQGVEVIGSKGDYAYKTVTDLKPSTLSDIAVGEVMIIRPYEHFSLAVVTKASEPVAPGAKALPPTND
ncbi:LysM peptidoglycan-binding domain-containing protein [Photobacterium nomapromontoriensis]|uniref:LysM peptidoglycan-binding domain-containing protein n=1 Tax=Photobacterium nomapromontoriensis TaxID=2910237 RepID=UPI003D0D316C